MNSLPGMRTWLLVVVSLLVACGGAARQTIRVDGRDRSFILHLPPNPHAGMPLVVALHGGGGHADSMVKATHFDAIADREGFVVVYPDGIGGHWNDGRKDNDAHADVDDVAFIRTLIDAMVAQHGIDPARVYATGISNGGMMSYRLACDLADKIAAIAPVAGAIPAEPPCTPSRPVAVLAINGTADPIVPYGGGQVHVFKDRGAVLGARASVDKLATVAGCTGSTYEQEPDHADDGTATAHLRYSGCRVPVELVDVLGGGHTWPGGQQYLPAALIGPVSREFSASERMWAFFNAR